MDNDTSIEPAAEGDPRITEEGLQDAWRASLAEFPMHAAPRDGTPIVGRDDKGDLALIRWRTHPDLEEEVDSPYWARIDTDELFAPIAWVPSPLTVDEILELYG